MEISRIYSAFPVLTIFHDNQIIDEGKFFME